MSPLSIKTMVFIVTRLGRRSELAIIVIVKLLHLIVCCEVYRSVQNSVHRRKIEKRWENSLYMSPCMVEGYYLL